MYRALCQDKPECVFVAEKSWNETDTCAAQSLVGIAYNEEDCEMVFQDPKSSAWLHLNGEALPGHSEPVLRLAGAQVELSEEAVGQFGGESFTISMNMQGGYFHVTCQWI